MMMFACMVAVALATGQFQVDVFSDLDTGHWATDGPATHTYAHHDHEHIHDHGHDHHPTSPHHPHHHHLTMEGEVLHHCEGDGTQPLEDTCLCQQTNGLFQQICTVEEDQKPARNSSDGEGGEPQYCDHFTGRCQQRSCFDACRFSTPMGVDDGARAAIEAPVISSPPTSMPTSTVQPNPMPGSDDEGRRRLPSRELSALDLCYLEQCDCDVRLGTSKDSPRNEEEKCQLPCADCGPFPVLFPESPEQKAANHEAVMFDIFGQGLEHGSDYNVRAMRPLETLSNIFF